MATAAFDRDGAPIEAPGAARRHRAAGPAVAPGARLDRYDILASLGRGGMADVWLAQQRGGHGFRKRVAIKTIRPEHAGKPSYRGRFLAEARIAASIHHTNVVEILDVGEQDGMVFQVMELVEGGSLERLLVAGEPLDPAIAARIITHAARGLAAAHSACDASGRPLHVVHRDVSPHNVLCGHDGFAKIADFGIALGLAGAEAREGKLGYMAPEQRAHAQVDARADVYSLGVVAWEALTGRRFRSAAATIEGVPEGLAHAVARALEPEPDRRWQTADDFADAIESAIVISSAKELGAFVRQRSAARDPA